MKTIPTGISASFAPMVDAMFPNEDARLKPIAKWE
jgi:hypothetical protein